MAYICPQIRDQTTIPPQNAASAQSLVSRTDYLKKKKKKSLWLSGVWFENTHIFQGKCTV